MPRWIKKCLCVPCLSVKFCCTKIWSSCYKSKSLIYRHMIWLFFITFMVVLPVFCVNLQYSLFFTTKTVKTNERYTAAEQHLREINDERLNQAQKYLAMLEQTKLHDMISKGHGGSADGVDIMISVVTVSRNRHQIDKYEPKYLTQIVWKLLSLYHKVQSDGYKYSVKMNLCNVDHDPHSYKEAYNVSRFLPLVNRFNNTYLSMLHPLEKEKQDYVFCLEQALWHKPKYVFLIEDDALPLDDFFTVLAHVIQNHLDSAYRNGHYHENTQSIAYVKFYHPQRLVGFLSIEPERIPEWLGYAAIFSSFSTWFYFLKYKLLFRTNSIHQVWLAFFAYFALVVLVIGRANVNEFRRLFPPYLYSFGPAPSCCTPAMLFTADGAKAVANYLSSVECKKSFGKDSALDVFLAKPTPKWHAYLIQPNLVSHIGQYSSLRSALVNPYLV